jgi:succinylglutamate desuccinylase
LHIIPGKCQNFKIRRTKYFEIEKEVAKTGGYALCHNVKNYRLVKKGTIFAKKSCGEPLVATEDFYPILFGNTNYEDIFGFMGKVILP